MHFVLYNFIEVQTQGKIRTFFLIYFLTVVCVILLHPKVLLSSHVWLSWQDTTQPADAEAPPPPPPSPIPHIPGFPSKHCKQAQTSHVLVLGRNFTQSSDLRRLLFLFPEGLTNACPSEAVRNRTNNSAGHFVSSQNLINFLKSTHRKQPRLLCSPGCSQGSNMRHTREH